MGAAAKSEKGAAMTDSHILVTERLEHNRWGLLATQGHVLGVDVGGYGLRAVLVDLHSHSCTSAHAEPSGHDPQRIVTETLALCQSLLDEQKVTSDRLVRIGVGFGGPVDSDQGIVLLSPRMRGWENFPLKQRFEEAFDAVTLVDNDANLIGLAEATFGVGRDVNQLFYLHLSSGVGGGLVLDGRLHHGATSTAGEIAHATIGIGPDGERLMTLEERVSISGLLNRAAELGLQTDNLEHLFDDGPIGKQVIAEAVTILGMRLSQVVAMLDPQMIVLGGIVTRIGGEQFVTAIGERMRQYIQPQFARPVQVTASVLDSSSIAIGGVALALESLQE